MSGQTSRPRTRANRWPLGLAGVVALLLVWSCSPPAASPPAAAPASSSTAPAPRAAADAPAAQPAPRAEPPLQPQSVVVRMDWIPWATHAPMHLAVERGWYAERGLDVEL